MSNTKFLILQMLRDAIIITGNLDHKTSDEIEGFERGWNWTSEASEIAYKYIDSLYRREKNKMKEV